MFWTKKKSLDALADEFGRTNDVGKFEAGLQRIDPATLSSDQREEWHHLWGVAAYRADNHKEARRRFQEGMAAVPASGLIAFSLGQEYEYIGDATRAFELFDRFMFPSIPAAYALAQARYAYLWNEFRRGTSYVRPIFDAYFRLGIADDNFLYIRELPFYGQAWAYLAAFGELEHALEPLEQLTAESKTRLADYDFTWQESYIRALASGDFRPLLLDIRTRASAQAKHGMSTGYSRMQEAVIQALEVDAEGGASILSAVKLKGDDFPWLNDVRTAALAALAARRGDPHVSGKYSREFLGQQPMLLEPDHASNFRLLSYQESLKSRYQQGRRRNANL